MNENGRIHRFGHKPRDYLTDVLARKGVAFIDRAADAHRPFFLELATFAPHGPYIPAPRDRARFPGPRRAAAAELRRAADQRAEWLRRPPAA